MLDTLHAKRPARQPALSWKGARGIIALEATRTQLDGRHRPVPRERVVRRPARQNNRMDAGRYVLHSDNALLAGESAQPPVFHTALFTLRACAPSEPPIRHGLWPSTHSIYMGCSKRSVIALSRGGQAPGRRERRWPLLHRCDRSTIAAGAFSGSRFQLLGAGALRSYAARHSARGAQLGRR